MQLRGWQFFLCLGKKKTQHSALMAKLQYIYMRWVRSQETIGLLVLEYSLINPDIPYNRGNTDSFIPIDSVSKAERSFFLHQAVVCGCSSKRAQAPGRNGASGNPNRTGRPRRNQKTFELKLLLQAFHLKKRERKKNPSSLSFQCFLWSPHEYSFH